MEERGIKESSFWRQNGLFTVLQSKAEIPRLQFSHSQLQRCDSAGHLSDRSRKQTQVRKKLMKWLLKTFIITKFMHVSATRNCQICSFICLTRTDNLYYKIQYNVYGSTYTSTSYSQFSTTETCMLKQLSKKNMPSVTIVLLCMLPHFTCVIAEKLNIYYILLCSMADCYVLL